MLNIPIVAFLCDCVCYSEHTAVGFTFFLLAGNQTEPKPQRDKISNMSNEVLTVISSCFQQHSLVVSVQKFGQQVHQQQTLIVSKQLLS